MSSPRPPGNGSIEGYGYPVAIHWVGGSTDSFSGCLRPFLKAKPLFPPPRKQGIRETHIKTRPQSGGGGDVPFLPKLAHEGWLLLSVQTRKAPGASLQCSLILSFTQLPIPICWVFKPQEGSCRMCRIFEVVRPIEPEEGPLACTQVWSYRPSEHGADDLTPAPGRPPRSRETILADAHRHLKKKKSTPHPRDGFSFAREPGFVVGRSFVPTGPK